MGLLESLPVGLHHGMHHLLSDCVVMMAAQVGSGPANDAGRAFFPGPGPAVPLEHQEGTGGNASVRPCNHAHLLVLTNEMPSNMSSKDDDHPAEGRCLNQCSQQSVVLAQDSNVAGAWGIHWCARGQRGVLQNLTLKDRAETGCLSSVGRALGHRSGCAPRLSAIWLAAKATSG